MATIATGFPFQTDSARGGIRVVDARTVFRDEWCLHTLACVTSTNTIAAGLPAWNAILADIQTAGRGRTGRHWTSDLGGLWLSAVLPCPASQACWPYLPLAAGWGAAKALRKMGVEGLRLRWPNDLMVGQKKLGGLLVERFDQETIVVGLGINVANTPEAHDRRLSGTTVRLAELVSERGTIEDLAFDLLSGLRFGHDYLQAKGFSAIAQEVNAHWTQPRMVELTLAGKTSRERGRFAGIDAQGALRLDLGEGREVTYDATQVALLRELD